VIANCRHGLPTSDCTTCALEQHREIDGSFAEGDSSARARRDAAVAREVRAIAGKLYRTSVLLAIDRCRAHAETLVDAATELNTLADRLAMAPTRTGEQP
jgi:hypothetical protein